MLWAGVHWPLHYCTQKVWICCRVSHWYFPWVHKLQFAVHKTEWCRYLKTIKSAVGENLPCSYIFIRNRRGKDVSRIFHNPSFKGLRCLSFVYKNYFRSCFLIEEYLYIMKEALHGVLWWWVRYKAMDFPQQLMMLCLILHLAAFMPSFISFLCLYLHLESYVDVYTEATLRTSVEHQQLTRHRKTLNILQHWCLTRGGSHGDHVGVSVSRQMRGGGTFFGPKTVRILLRKANSLLNAHKTNSVALSPQANYTDWATATCRRS
jgi:hypothetical protein